MLFLIHPFQVLIDDINKAVSCGSNAFAIPPCIGSLHLYENIQVCHLLRKIDNMVCYTIQMFGR